MKSKLSASLFLLVFLAGCQQPTWKEFSSAGGAFSVLMPGTPTEQVRTADTASGPINAHMFLVEQGDVVYTVAYSDYPDTVVQEGTSNLILDGARDGAVAKVQGALLSDTIVSVDGHQGRELIIEAAGGKVTIQTRLVIVRRRFYQVMVITPKEKALSEDVNKFLDSFTFLKK
jgi:hypothetical protein